MTTLDKTIQPQASGLAKVWQRTPVLMRAIIMALFIGIVGANGIGVISIALPPPVSLIAILAYLFLFWKFFSGSWGPKATAETRKINFRAGRLSPRLWKWSLLLAAVFVLVVESGLVVTFRLIQFPADRFAMGFGFESLPLWAAWAIILIASLSAGLTEEAGFRGYGSSNSEIAGELVISASTVKGHVSNILSKLHLADRTQAAVYAWNKGVVHRD